MLHQDVVGERRAWVQWTWAYSGFEACLMASRVWLDARLSSFSIVRVAYCARFINRNRHFLHRTFAITAWHMAALLLHGPEIVRVGVALAITRRRYIFLTTLLALHQRGTNLVGTLVTILPEDRYRHVDQMGKVTCTRKKSHAFWFLIHSLKKTIRSPKILGGGIRIRNLATNKNARGSLS